MSLSKVTRNYQITIPADIRERMHIRVGTLLAFRVDHGEIMLKPKVLVDEDQAWFWTKEWQKEEKEVDKARKKGQTKKVDNAREMRKHFEE